MTHEHFACEHGVLPGRRCEKCEPVGEDMKRLRDKALADPAKFENLISGLFHAAQFPEKTGALTNAELATELDVTLLSELPMMGWGFALVEEAIKRLDPARGQEEQTNADGLDRDTFIEERVGELLSLGESWDETSARKEAEQEWETEQSYREFIIKP